MYKGINFARQHLVPVDDGNLYRAIFQDGALHGCELSYTGAVLTMAAGYIMAGGRQINTTEAETFTLNEQSSGFARVLLEIDLTMTSTESSFQQVSTIVQYAATKEGFASLVQQDINNGGTVYQMQLALVSLGVGGITEIVEDLPQAELKGGSGGLNFSIVTGTSEPANPSENTIWVNTDEAMNGWIFSPVQPTTRPDGSALAGGELWIAIGNASSVPFNALVTGGIIIYPLMVKQYIGGEWVAKVAKSYRNGSWVDWITFVYNHGDLCESLTGGAWVATAQAPDSSTQGAKPTITYNADNMVISQVSGKGGFARTANKIDLTPYKTLRFQGSLTGASASSETQRRYHALCLYSALGTYISSNTGAAIRWTTVDDSTVDIDITGYTGEYYIVFSFYGAYTATVKEISLLR